MFAWIRAAMRSRGESGEVVPMRLQGQKPWTTENISREAEAAEIAAFG